MKFLGFCFVLGSGLGWGWGYDLGLSLGLGLVGLKDFRVSAWLYVSTWPRARGLLTHNLCYFREMRKQPSKTYAMSDYLPSRKAGEHRDRTNRVSRKYREFVRGIC